MTKSYIQDEVSLYGWVVMSAVEVEDEISLTLDMI